MDSHKTDSVFAWLTGTLCQVVGMVTFEGVVYPLLMALGGGFLGYLGKELASRVVNRFWPKNKGEE